MSRETVKGECRGRGDERRVKAHIVSDVAVSATASGRTYVWK